MSKILILTGAGISAESGIDTFRDEEIDREEFLDSLADQVVTAIGAGHCAGMKTAEAIERVNVSNWTKTVDGEFQRDANGKIAKPSTYVPPDLKGLY